MNNTVLLIGNYKYIDHSTNTLYLQVPRKDEEDLNAPVKLSCKLLENVIQYCKINDIMGVKGHLRNTEDGRLIVIAEKLTFLSSYPEKGGD